MPSNQGIRSVNIYAYKETWSLVSYKTLYKQISGNKNWLGEKQSISSWDHFYAPMQGAQWLLLKALRHEDGGRQDPCLFEYFFLLASGISGFLRSSRHFTSDKHVYDCDLPEKYLDNPLLLLLVLRKDRKRKIKERKFIKTNIQIVNTAFVTYYSKKTWNHVCIGYQNFTNYLLLFVWSLFF